MIPESDLRAAAAAIDPDARIAEAEPLDGGSSAAVVRMTLELPGGTRLDVVVRQHRDRAGKGHSAAIASKEFHLLRTLADRGFPVPEPFAIHGDDTSGGPWFATDWVDGSTMIEDSVLDDVLDQMAVFLAGLHSLDPAELHVPGVDRVEDPVVEIHRYLPSTPIGRALGATLAAGISRSPNDDVLLHGDFWPGNVLVRESTVVAVIDWEDAAIGDPVADLASARIELVCAYGDDAAERFTDCYLGEVGPLDLGDLPLWESYASSSALSSMHRWGLDPDEEAGRRATTSACFDRAAGLLSGR